MAVNCFLLKFNSTFHQWQNCYWFDVLWTLLMHEFHFQRNYMLCVLVSRISRFIYNRGLEKKIKMKNLKCEMIEANFVSHSLVMKTWNLFNYSFVWRMYTFEVYVMSLYYFQTLNFSLHSTFKCCFVKPLNRN